MLVPAGHKNKRNEPLGQKPRVHVSGCQVPSKVVAGSFESAFEPFSRTPSLPRYSCGSLVPWPLITGQYEPGGHAYCWPEP